VLCEQRLRSRAFLLDSTRLISHALARVLDAIGEEPGVSEADLVHRGIDAAIDDLLAEDEWPDDVGAWPGEEQGENAHAALLATLGVERGLVRRASRRFNALPESTRRVFFALVMDGVGFEECVLRGLGTSSTLGRELRLAFAALLTGARPAVADPAERASR